MSDFVDRIDELLSEKKMNRNALYEKFNISKNLIGQWKQRGTIPSADIVCKIAEFLDTSAEYLVTGKERNIYKTKYDSLLLDIQTAIEKNK